jgi:dUTP pyrophosphatase
MSNSIELKVKLLIPEAKLPVYSSTWAAGMDVHASTSLTIPPKTTALVKTGIAVSWTGPDATNYYLRVAPRSGLAFKSGIFVNAGVIDWDYRGEIGVVLYNSSDVEFDVKTGDRVAQMILEKINRVSVVPTETLDSTDRGSGGFGSTGI